MAFPSFTSDVHALIAASPIPNLLENHSALVFERIARGGGATNWYYCADNTHLQVVISRFRPGSVVSFYFDDRIRRVMYTPEHSSDMEQIIMDTRDVVVGFLTNDHVSIEMNIISGPEELVQTLSTFDLGSAIFYGATPSRENDDRAVTLVLPDDDGLVRPHPH